MDSTDDQKFEISVCKLDHLFSSPHWVWGVLFPLLGKLEKSSTAEVLTLDSGPQLAPLHFTKLNL